jgi:hypothetical protein
MQDRNKRLSHKATSVKGASQMTRISKWLPKLALVATSVMAISATAVAAEKPNILVIFGDDIGQTNISAYSMAWWATRLRTSTGLPRKA